MSQFRLGDLVRLKGTSGPIMVVCGQVHSRTKFPKGTKIVCTWHDQLDRARERAYLAKLLEHFEPAPTSYVPSENCVG